MNILLNFLILLLSAGLLWTGAVWIVDSASVIARRFNLSELTIGLTIVAMGTSLPEFLVTATAALHGYGDISLSNVVGSNIFNLGIILGLMALINPIPADRILIRRDGLLLLFLSLALLYMVIDRQLTLVNGLFLLAVFAAYNLFVILRGPRLNLELEMERPREAMPRDYLKLILGFAFIAAGGHFMVKGAVSLAEALGVSQWVIGVTIVAAGTSLPELITCLVASLKKKNDILLGNLVGSDIFNFAGVLGLTCLIKPIETSSSAPASVISLIIMVILVMIFMRTGYRIGRWEGLTLILVAVTRWILDFTLF